VSDPFNIDPKENPGNNDPYAFKAKHDTDSRKLRTEGVPGIWRQITNLLILFAVLAVIFLVVRGFR
jgi:hypothetical protein